jgi:hypothetical protein
LYYKELATFFHHTYIVDHLRFSGRGLVKSNPCADVKNSAEMRTEKGVLTEHEAWTLIGLLNTEAETLGSLRRYCLRWVVGLDAGKSGACNGGILRTV